MQRSELWPVVSWATGGQQNWHFSITEPNGEPPYPGSAPPAGTAGLGGKKVKERTGGLAALGYWVIQGANSQAGKEGREDDRKCWLIRSAQETCPAPAPLLCISPRGEAAPGVRFTSPSEQTSAARRDVAPGHESRVALPSPAARAGMSVPSQLSSLTSARLQSALNRPKAGGHPLCCPLSSPRRSCGLHPPHPAADDDHQPSRLAHGEGSWGLCISEAFPHTTGKKVWHQGCSLSILTRAVVHSTVRRLVAVCVANACLLPAV